MGVQIRPYGPRKYAIYCTVTGKRVGPFFERRVDVERYYNIAESKGVYFAFGRFDPRLIPKNHWTKLKKETLKAIAESDDEEDYSVDDASGEDDKRPKAVAPDAIAYDDSDDYPPIPM